MGESLISAKYLYIRSISSSRERILVTFGDFSPAVTIPPLDNGEQQLRIVRHSQTQFLIGSGSHALFFQYSTVNVRVPLFICCQDSSILPLDS